MGNSPLGFDTSDARNVKGALWLVYLARDIDFLCDQIVLVAQDLKHQYPQTPRKWFHAKHLPHPRFPQVRQLSFLAPSHKFILFATVKIYKGPALLVFHERKCHDGNPRSFGAVSSLREICVRMWSASLRLRYAWQLVYGLSSTKPIRSCPAHDQLQPRTPSKDSRACLLFHTH